MFMVSRLYKDFSAPKERDVAGVNRRLQHFAPLELLSLWISFDSYKHSAPPELRRLVAGMPRCVSVA